MLARNDLSFYAIPSIANDIFHIAKSFKLKASILQRENNIRCNCEIMGPAEIWESSHLSMVSSLL